MAPSMLRVMIEPPAGRQATVEFVEGADVTNHFNVEPRFFGSMRTQTVAYITVVTAEGPRHAELRVAANTGKLTLHYEDTEDSPTLELSSVN